MPDRSGKTAPKQKCPKGNGAETCTWKIDGDRIYCGRCGAHPLS